VLTIVKNYYVPLYVANNSPPNVQPVDIDIKWREIHYLVNAKGEPIDKDGRVLPQPTPSPLPPPGTTYPTSGVMPSSQQGASNSPAPTGALVATTAGNNAPPVSAPVAPTQPAAPAPAPAATTTTSTTPAAPASVPANGPAKQWVFLPSEGVYGYGYQRADGYWIIDEGSRQANPPTTTASAN
jgi:hypothetical protein